MPSTGTITTITSVQNLLDDTRIMVISLSDNQGRGILMPGFNPDVQIQFGMAGNPEEFLTNGLCINSLEGEEVVAYIWADKGNLINIDRIFSSRTGWENDAQPVRSVRAGGEKELVINPDRTIEMHDL